MPFFYEIAPVFLFFMAFKYYGIYVATLVGMIIALAQVISTRLWRAQWDHRQLVTLGIFVSLGGMTLYFHNPLFIKWKPTLVFWLFASIIVGNQYVNPKPLIQRLLRSSLPEESDLPSNVWKQLDRMWALFFTLIGSVNLYVAYHYTDAVWVNFKFYGIMGSLFLFTLGQGAYLFHYLSTTRTLSSMNEDK